MTWYRIEFPDQYAVCRGFGCVTRIYGDNVYAQKAAKLRQTIAEMSYNGEFFVDNAVRKNGKLIRTTNISEVCQYYAVRFGIADFGNPRYDALRHVILNVFGPGREDELNHIIKSNAFIGVYLRLEVLLMMGEYEILCDNIKRYFGPMSESTGTLWEYLQLNGSHDHGFASFAALAIARIVEHNVSSKRLKMEGMLK